MFNKTQSASRQVFSSRRLTFSLPFSLFLPPRVAFTHWSSFAHLPWVLLLSNQGLLFSDVLINIFNFSWLNHGVSCSLSLFFFFFFFFCGLPLGQWQSLHAILGGWWVIILSNWVFSWNFAQGLSISSATYKLISTNSCITGISFTKPESNSQLVLSPFLSLTIFS